MISAGTRATRFILFGARRGGTAKCLSGATGMLESVARVPRGAVTELKHESTIIIFTARLLMENRVSEKARWQRETLLNSVKLQLLRCEVQFQLYCCTRLKIAGGESTKSPGRWTAR